MTIIPIIINGKFLMIAAPKKQIKNSKHISAKIRMYGAQNETYIED